MRTQPAATTGVALIATLASAVAVAADELHVKSPAFEACAAIPARYTCQGRDVSPPIHWSGLPDGTRSVALIADDPDAPDETWVHWVVFNLPPDAGGLPKATSGQLPGNATEGRNSWGKAEYGGPCPPSGTHHYKFRLFALDNRLRVDKPGKAELLGAMAGHVLRKATLTGTYRK